MSGNRLRGGLGIAVCAILIVVAPQLVDDYWLGILTQGLIFALAAASLDVLVGTSGMASLGQAAFFGLGGYGVGVGTIRYEWSPGVAFGAGLALALVGAVVFGALAIRSRGIYFLVITLAFSQLLWGVSIKWTDVTGGYNGLPGVRRPQPFGLDLNEPATFYYAVAVLVAVCLLVLWMVVRSPIGLTLRGIRSSELRMSFLGYRTAWYRWFAFVVAGFFAGFAGSMNATYLRFVGPDSLFWTLSAFFVLMVVIGGAGSLWGPATAGIGLVVFQNWVSSRTERWVLILGLLYIATIMFAPNGVFRAIGGLRGRLSARSSPPDDRPPQPSPVPVGTERSLPAVEQPEAVS